MITVGRRRKDDVAIEKFLYHVSNFEEVVPNSAVTTRGSGRQNRYVPPGSEVVYEGIVEPLEYFMTESLGIPKKDAGYIWELNKEPGVVCRFDKGLKTVSITGHNTVKSSASVEAADSTPDHDRQSARGNIGRR